MNELISPKVVHKAKMGELLEKIPSNSWDSRRISQIFNEKVAFNIGTESEKIQRKTQFCRVNERKEGKRRK